MNSLKIHFSQISHLKHERIEKTLNNTQIFISETKKPRTFDLDHLSIINLLSTTDVKTNATYELKPKDRW